MSLLAILKVTKANGLNGIVIIEDDLDWSRAFCKMSVEGSSKLFDGNRRFLHGGLEARLGPVRRNVLDTESRAMQTHFMALRGDAISRAAECLKSMTNRPAGS